MAGRSDRTERRPGCTRRPTSPAGRPAWDDAVVLHGDHVWLFPGAEVIVDVVRFEDLARRAGAEDDPVARDALAWYGGELLPSDPYEDWAGDRRELLALRRLDLLRVAGEWRDVAELDPTDEEAQLRLMHRHLAAGDGRRRCASTNTSSASWPGSSAWIR